MIANMIRRTMYILLVISLLTAGVGTISYSYPMGFTLIAKPLEGRYIGIRIERGNLIWIDCGLSRFRFQSEFDVLYGERFIQRTTSYQQANWNRIEVINRFDEPLQFMTLQRHTGAVNSGIVLPSNRAWRKTLYEINYGVATLLPLLFAFGCFALQVALRLKRRMHNGLCSKCAYDLTGNTSGRCPECGTEIPAGEPA